ncbi:hypothetical protein KY330_05895 [Candidatus Woesearchaeota archaeon]|nr:hypothetical protein [Candidatus Woesearchaeota archaeon]
MGNGFEIYFECGDVVKSFLELFDNIDKVMAVREFVLRDSTNETKYTTKCGIRFHKRFRDDFSLQLMRDSGFDYRYCDADVRKKIRWMIETGKVKHMTLFNNFFEKSFPGYIGYSPESKLIYVGLERIMDEDLDLMVNLVKDLGKFLKPVAIYQSFDAQSLEELKERCSPNVLYYTPYSGMSAPHPVHKIIASFQA